VAGFGCLRIGTVAICCECGDEPLGSCATKLFIRRIMKLSVVITEEYVIDYFWNCLPVFLTELWEIISVDFNVICQLLIRCSPFVGY
jgi:hypothetical protein